MQLETKKDIRAALEGTAFKQVSFPEWVGTANREGEPRSIQFRAPSGRLILISATSYQTLNIQEV